MISILAKINEAIKVSRIDKELVINEDFKDGTGKLFLSGVLSQDALDKWSEVCDLKENWLKVVFIDNSRDEIHPSESSPGEKHSITVSFVTFEENRHIFTEEGWNIFLYNDKLLSKVKNIYLAFTSHSFETFAYTVSPWEKEPTNQEKYPETHYTPSLTKGIIKYYSPEFTPPEKASSWILKAQVEIDNKALSIWKDLSCKELLKSLTNELYVSDVKMIGLSGKPPRKMAFGDVANCVTSFAMIQNVAKWVYLEGEEVELKHTFLTNELAREWPDETTFCNGISVKLTPAFESARLLYKAHIRSSSKDTIKALGDLRKNLADDTQKIVQQSRDLTSSMWKDVALTMSAIIIKYTLDAAKSPATPKVYAFVFFAIAIYIIVSHFINIFINRKFLKLLENNRTVWRKKLYNFLDDSDYNELASKPINDSYLDYKAIEKVSILITSLSAVSLITIGLSNFISFENFLFFLKTQYDIANLKIIENMARIYTRH
ncbi:hypothetical protein [Serratia plymuthica]|uniref:hypothetical protein n=1 Tax=Serratia plymuthica TaxID=82996 RepID=UPI0014194ED1|nr:hypothetical protein [Serratia plymuthica]MBI6140625.1 hypothetical protein [Serratia plymuthica]NIC28151.1 hypothetical protein [Serratia plymuthica]